MILLGQPGVGKTSLLARITHSRNTPCYQPTIGIDFGSTTTSLFDGPVIKTQIWDTAGQEKYRSLVLLALGLLLLEFLLRNTLFKSFI